MLLGRDAERAVLAELVARAAQSHAGAMVLHGDPGAGKTALLDDLVATSPGVRVLRTQGVESESPLAYAALHRLLRPLLPHLDLVPEPQARALGVALGRVGGDRVDPFLVALATLSLLTEAAEARPALVVVDDAHWLDAASADALLFAVRRLDADRVAVVFAVRDGMTTTFVPDGVPTLRVGRLDAVSALALLRGTAAAVAPDVADRLVSECGGNPLALVELAAALTPDQLAGDAPIPAHLPLTARLERVFLDRARRLPADAQTLMLIVAADDSGRVAAVSRAAAVLGVDEEAMDQAEASGLVARDGDALRCGTRSCARRSTRARPAASAGSCTARSRPRSRGQRRPTVGPGTARQPRRAPTTGSPPTSRVWGCGPSDVAGTRPRPRPTSARRS